MTNLTTQRKSPLPQADISRDTPVNLDRLDVDQRLRQEMQRLSAGIEIAATPSHPEIFLDNEVEALRAENVQLKAQVQELEQFVELAAIWEEKQKEYDSLLEEKSEVIRTLHQKIQAYQEGRKAELEEDLIPLKQEIEEQRRQLKEDEESLLRQMREMEMTMARERAELARQRNDLQRTQIEIQRELERASQDGNLRERLQALTQRRGSDANLRKTCQMPQPPAADSPPPQPAPKSSGLFRRLFGA